MIAKSWFSGCWHWTIGGLVEALSIVVSERVWAQIVPDNTLGAEGSVVTPDVNIRGTPSDQLDGRAIRGANLFHSFAQFNVGAGRGAYFTNPAGIANILSRVTGANRSQILGRLGVLGNANLFLINPHGIVFGPAASLDVQGSFLATTADAVKLSDAGLFSASQPATSSLLTVSPSALWFNAIAAQPIVNQSQAQRLIDRQPNAAGLSPGRLQVQPDRTLALVGGNVLLEGGRLTAAGGRIELGSVARVGEVSLTQSGNRLALGYDSINDFGNISLSNGAFVDASGEGGGGVQIRGARLELAQSSNIWANTLGAQNGGQPLVGTTEVVLSGGSLTADVASTGTGTGGDLKIATGRLLVSDGSEVSAGTFIEGKGGSLQITASESVNVIGTSGDGKRLSSLLTQTDGSGDAGNLRIATERLLVSDGAQVSAGTFAESDGSGNAGNLRIATGRLLVSNGAAISNRSRGGRTAGNIDITARDTLQAVNGSIKTDTSRSAGGAITIKAGDIRLEGNSDIRTNVAFGADKGGSITLTADSILAFDDSDILAFARDGEGGDITFDTPAFFGESYRPAPRGTDPANLDNNNRVDANATGAVSGDITIPDTTFIQNSLSDLPDNQIDTNTLLANSCIVRRNQPTRGSFTITGTGGLPQRPGDAQMSSLPTVDVATLPSESTSSTTNSNHAWQKGGPIVEPQGVYRLPDGKLMLSRKCS